MKKLFAALLVAALCMSSVCLAEDDDLAGKFGTMGLDMDRISSYIDELGNNFEREYAKANQFAEALDKAAENFKAASVAFASQMMTSSLTELTQTDIDSLTQLANDMSQYVRDAIDSGNAGDVETLAQTYGGVGIASHNSSWRTIMDVLMSGYDSDVEEAHRVEQGLLGAMEGAFEDGVLSADEVFSITTFVSQQNGLIDFYVNPENYISE